ncbi:glycine cleavage system protein R [Paraburkholderia aromaticivorans]|uniref:glycine cleavage system protein R n=1 Tax=Paraburkholderia aromaticivorans TaxID=2026199 RepID=UPI001455FEDF|nr:ACT domain-containing protein [Paraburkholderia aromaticivorans]
MTLTITLVLTVIGEDRPGLVNAIAEKTTEFGANWLDTRLVSLGGKFAGIVLVSVSQANADALVGGLQSLRSNSLSLTLERRADAAALAPARALKLELVSHDRPGIVREIAGLLAGNKVSIEELETDLVSGSFSGENLFKARARLRAPLELDVVVLRDMIENLANELMADISIDEDVTN